MTDETLQDMAKGDTDLSDGVRGAKLAAFDSPLDRDLMFGRIGAAMFTTPAQPSVASVIGRFAILRKLGQGGMGVVYLGYDERLDRRVAVKLLRASDGGANSQARMLREAQALARLSHQNVVQVYESAIHDDALFIAMEFVAGRTLGRWIRDEPRARAEILAVFTAAGRGLAAAHAAKLVHRDFKPDNVMVGDDGGVKVMDFGLVRPQHDLEELDEQARTLEDASQGEGESLTRTGAIMGTPAYMAPEQHRGLVVDARSDQYSFCVALWEALYGARPFEGTTLAELADNVIEGRRVEPPRGADVPSWLRAVISRGLDPSPERRWPSMEALLDELGRDPSRRWRRALAGATLAAALAGIGWGAASIGAGVPAPEQQCANMDADLVGVWDDDRRAAVEAALVGTKLSYAADTWSRVEAELDDYAAGWVEARTEACEATRRGLQSGALLDLRMACLDRRKTELGALVTVLSEADEAVVSKAAAAARSLALLERCADVEALAAELPPPEDPAEAERALALDGQLAEAKALHKAGRYEAAASIARAVVDEARALDHGPSLVSALLLHGGLEDTLGQHEAAEQTLREAYDLGLGLGMIDEAAQAASSLVFVVGRQLGRHDEGLRWSIDAEPLSRASGSLDTRARALNNLGTVHDARGDYEQAREVHERALALHEQAHGPEHTRVADVLANLGGIARTQGKYDDALAYSERALKIREAALGPEHPEVGKALAGLGITMDMRGDYERARDYHERALRIMERSYGADHPMVAITLGNLGIVARLSGEPEQARAYYERALAIDEAAYGPAHRSVAHSLHNLANLAISQGELDTARAHHERALAIFEDTLGSDHSSVAATRHGLCVVAHNQGRLDEAREHGARALQIWEQALGPNHHLVASALTCLAKVDLSEGRNLGARAGYERALAIFEATLGPDHSELGQPLMGLGEVALAEGAAAEALAPLERALALGEAAQVEDPDLAELRFILARALWDAPRDRGRDRARARQLAASARADLERGWDASALAQVEAWLARTAESPD